MIERIFSSASKALIIGIGGGGDRLILCSGG